MPGPTPRQTREIIQDLIDALALITNRPRYGGPETLGQARALAREALRTMPQRYMPRDEEWIPAPEREG